MNSISMHEMMHALSKLSAKGLKTTLLGIGPMSETLILATLKLAKEKSFPIMFIASRNQIDAEEFGRGYVRNWDQADFAGAIRRIADDIGFDGLCYLCRDHGGPWQRDKERSDKLPPDEAMNIAKASFLADLEAGFHLLHIDPTKDPHVDGVVPMESVISRTVDLIEYVEEQRKKLNLSPVAYEVGTEETNGGLTSPEAYEDFINQLSGRLNEKGLPLPLFIVGQTGTLTRLTENVGHFDAVSARRLSEAAMKHGIGLKEHNGDYLPDSILLAHPALGITAANVAPEFGVAETAAYLTLAEIERKFYEINMLDKQSNLFEIIKTETVNDGRWRKWLVDDDAHLPADKVLANDDLSKLITNVGGHYSFEKPAVKNALSLMFNNLATLGINPQDYVESYIKRVIGRYTDSFNMTGLTERIMKEC